MILVLILHIFGILFCVALEFIVIFPTNFLGMPLEHDIDFFINVEPGTKPITIHSYSMALAELKKLNAQW